MEHSLEIQSYEREFRLHKNPQQQEDKTKSTTIIVRDDDYFDFLKQKSFKVTDSETPLPHHRMRDMGDFL